MLPNFHDGDFILTEMVSYNLLGHAPQRGDVVVFRAPQEPGLDFIKRIIGLPHEKLELQNGKVYIFNTQHPQGFLLKEPYLVEGTKTEGRQTIHDGEIYTIGDAYVVFGDNREWSSDSREWGPIKKDSIIGRVWIRYWPPQAFSLIETPKY